jgi:hypothetical protein
MAIVRYHALLVKVAGQVNVELTHVWSNEHELWKSIILKIFLEHCEVLNLSQSIEL